MSKLSILGERINELLNERKIDIGKLSADTSLDRNDVYHWRQGKYSPSVKNLVILADYFSVTCDYLLGISDECNATSFNVCPPFSQRIAFLLEYTSKNISRFAKLTNIDRNTIYSWLDGTRQPQVDALVKIANAFDMTIDFVLGREK